MIHIGQKLTKQELIARKRKNPKTKAASNLPPCSTLFVSNVPDGIPEAELVTIFSEQPGFMLLRKKKTAVRTMAFVDFESIQQATNALTRMQGYRFVALPEHDGLVVSYDMSSEATRAKAVDDHRRELQSANHRTYACAACGEDCVQLDAPMDGTRTRKTDGAVVVDAAHVLQSLWTQGAEVKIRREKGIERQFRYACAKCSLPLAYRTAPFGEEAKHLFVLKDVLSLKPPDGAAAVAPSSKRHRLQDSDSLPQEAAAAATRASASDPTEKAL